VSAPARRADWSLERIAAVLRRVIGVPDYGRYVEHMRACHPDDRPLTRDAFMRQRLHDRYSKPGARCC
jgi:uncharacterized short protein YbdD (DUF466 family)